MKKKHALIALCAAMLLLLCGCSEASKANWNI